MTGERGMSTVVDVALGLVLLGAAAGVIATAPVAPEQNQPQAGAPVLLGPTLTVEFQTESGHWTVEETVGGLVGRAAIAGSTPSSDRSAAFREAVETSVRRYLDAHAASVQVVGVCRGTDSVDPLLIGPAPPGDRPVRATVYALPATHSATNGSACDPVVVLRRWSV
ncbi:MAG: hypothetical protein ABEJ60_05430 [Halodesulfurarchaeum sp.]